MPISFQSQKKSVRRVLYKGADMGKAGDLRKKRKAAAAAAIDEDDENDIDSFPSRMLSSASAADDDDDEGGSFFDRSSSDKLLKLSCEALRVLSADAVSVD
jgi:hypothetical protein